MTIAIYVEDLGKKETLSRDDGTKLDNTHNHTDYNRIHVSIYKHATVRRLHVQNDIRNADASRYGEVFYASYATNLFSAFLISITVRI